MFKHSKEELVAILKEEGYVSKRDLIDDHDFMSDLGKLVEIARAKEVSKVRERKLEEFSEKELEMEKSTEPWCDVMVLGFDLDKGFAIRTGWNSAMIKQLKELGFEGDEERIIQQWIGRLGVDSLVEEYDL